jgi:hypothetical protein
LAEWCLTRRGQVIVCEGPDGEWLPFKHLATSQGRPWMGREAKPTVEHVMTRTTHRRCAQCDIPFPASRLDARFCSATCSRHATSRGQAEQTLTRASSSPRSPTSASRRTSSADAATGVEADAGSSGHPEPGGTGEANFRRTNGWVRRVTPPSMTTPLDGA